MRVGLLTTILLFVLNANATTYYISNAGSDAANGTSTGTSWQTISKINGFTFASGDSILFKCGDTWNERLTPSSNLYFGSYSTGTKPLITGFTNPSFGAPSSNVYTATISNSVLQQNTILFNGKLGIKARYPNSVYLVYSDRTDSTLTTSLTGTPGYVGSEIVIKAAHWVIDVSKVIQQTVGALKVSPKFTYNATLGCNGFFFQNDASFLDSTNEFSYDSVNKVLKVYATSTPTVQYSNIDTLVWIRKKNNITFNNLSFTGANKAAFQLDTCSYITIRNCSINNCGSFGVIGEKSHHTTISNDSIQNCLSNGVYMRRVDPYTPMQDTCNSTTVSTCYFKNIAMYPGMGLSGNERYTAIEICGDSTRVTKSVFDSIGYIGIRWNGRYGLIDSNYVRHYGGVKDDVGGIYTVVGAYISANYNDSSIVRANIVGDGIGNYQGTDTTSIYAASTTASIYLDDDCKAISVVGNTGFGCRYKNFNLRTPSYITATDNIFVDSLANVVNATGSNSTNHNNSFRRNIFYQKNPSNYVFYTEAKQSLSSADSDYYARPTDTSTIIYWGGRILNFKAFQDSTGMEVHGGRAPRLILNTSATLFYNPTFSDSTITLDDNTYIDVYNNVLINGSSFVLRPFTSRLLFRHTYNYSKSNYFFTGNP